MEKIFDNNNGNNDILDEEHVACNKPAAQSSPFKINDKVSFDCEETLDILTNDSIIKSTFCEKSVNETCCNSEDAGNDELHVNFVNTAKTGEGVVSEKLISQKLLENAVKAVKNLFSPVKAHGMFSSAPARTELPSTEVGCKKLLYEEQNDACDRASPSDGVEKIQKTSSSQNDIEKRRSAQERENGNNSVQRSSSNPLDTHNSTNDSYTTTVSRMDESFQSTVSDFDEFTRGDMNKSNAETTIAENIYASDTFFNETFNGIDSSLNKTLKTSPVSENDNDTIVAPSGLKTGFFDPGNKDDASDVTESIVLFDAKAETQSNNDVINNNYTKVGIDAEDGASRDEANVVCSSPPTNLDNLLSFEEDKNNLTEILTSNSLPGEKHLSANFFDRSFIDIVVDKLNRLAVKNSENAEDSDKSATARPSLYVDASEPSETNHSSETDCSVLSVRSEELFSEKVSNRQTKDLEKNFSTSTIVISKGCGDDDDDECMANCSSPGGLDDAPKYPLAQKNTTTLIYNGISSNSEGGDHDGIRDFGASYTVLKDYGKGKDGPEENSEAKQVCAGAGQTGVLKEAESVAGSSLPKHYFFSGATSPSLMPLNLAIDHSYSPKRDEVNSAMEDINSGVNDNKIPLASQKSYTFLHNPNPGLNRPVVIQENTDVRVDKFSEIILDKSTSSDFNVCYDKSIKEDMARSKNSTNELEMLISSMDLLRITNEVRPSIAAVAGEDSTSVAIKSESAGPDVSLPDPILSLPLCGESSNAVVNSGQDSNAAVLPEMVVNNILARANSEQFTASNGKSDVTEKSEAAKSEASSIDGSCRPRCELQTEPALCLVAGDAPRDGVAEEEKVFPCGEVETSESFVSFTDTSKPNDKIKEAPLEIFSKFHNDCLASGDEAALCENLKELTKGQVKSSDVELTELIREQFTATDIEKICSVVCDIPELNLSKNIVMASQQFDKSFMDKSAFNDNGDPPKGCDLNANATDYTLSSSCFDFLDSIKGKPSTRDYSRESIYIKFDPLVQAKNSNKLLTFSEGDKENVDVSPAPKSNGPVEQLIPITPLKQAHNSNAPLSPLTAPSQKESKSVEKLNKLREMQSEIFRLREFYLQREERDKGKMNNFENEIARLTGTLCLLEERLKEKEERERSLVKKLTGRNESIERLNKLLEEYLTYTSKLTDQIEATRMESQKEIAVLKDERDYYMGHLRGTEQAFSDVHSKYEKCKKAVETLRKNEDVYKANIEELKLKVEQYADTIKDVRETATKEVSLMYEKMNDMKASHAQEISRLRAQLRKTELQYQAIQEALERKIKENQELAGICDELIEGKK